MRRKSVTLRLLWEDFKRPVQQAGWGNELNTFPDLYIAFYRWALWKLFEREGADDQQNWSSYKGFGDRVDEN